MENAGKLIVICIAWINSMIYEYGLQTTLRWNDKSNQANQIEHVQNQLNLFHISIWETAHRKHLEREAIKKNRR